MIEFESAGLGRTDGNCEGMEGGPVTSLLQQLSSQKSLSWDVRRKYRRNWPFLSVLLNLQIEPMENHVVHIS